MMLVAPITVLITELVTASGHQNRQARGEISNRLAFLGPADCVWLMAGCPVSAVPGPPSGGR